MRIEASARKIVAGEHEALADIKKTYCQTAIAVAGRDKSGYFACRPGIDVSDQ
jgi:hypothetical protein